MKRDHPKLSVRRQCTLLSLTRSSLYYQPVGESTENLRFMEIIHCLAGDACIAEKGQTVSGDAVVWLATDGPLYEASWPPMRQASSVSPDELDATGSNLSGAQYQQEEPGAQDLAVSAEGSVD